MTTNCDCNGTCRACINLENWNRFLDRKNNGTPRIVNTAAQDEAKTVEEIIKAFLVPNEPRKTLRCFDALTMSGVNRYDASKLIAMELDMPYQHVKNICGIR